MARTVNTPINVPREVTGGSRITGNDGGNPTSWQELAEAVNSCLNHKAPVLVCDTHGVGERWMGESYPVGTSYKHRYKFPTPYRALNNITYRASVWLRGCRPTAYAGASTTWEVSYSVDGAASVTVEVNAGAVGTGGGTEFVHKLADLALDYTADFTTFDIWLKTFGASMGTDSAIYCLEIRWYAGFSALPVGLYNLADYGVPMFGVDAALLDADYSLAAGLIQTMAAILEYCYERTMPMFVTSAASFNTTSPYINQLMENATSTFEVFAQCRAWLPPGSPGVSAWVYVIDSKNGGDSDIKLEAGGNSITDTSTSNDTWESANAGPPTPYLSVDCENGAIVTLSATHIKIGTIMIFARPAVL